MISCCIYGESALRKPYAWNLGCYLRKLFGESLAEANPWEIRCKRSRKLIPMQARVLQLSSISSIIIIQMFLSSVYQPEKFLTQTWKWKISWPKMIGVHPDWMTKSHLLIWKNLKSTPKNFNESKYSRSLEYLRDFYPNLPDGVCTWRKEWSTKNCQLSGRW